MKQKQVNDEYHHYLYVQNKLTGQYDIMPITQYQSNLIQDYDNYFKAASYGGLFNREDGILNGIKNPVVARTSDSNTANPLTFNLKNAKKIEHE